MYKQMRENKKLFLILAILGIIATSLILLFLSGKIIDYPKEPDEGDMTMAKGIFIIMAVTGGITVLLALKHGDNKQLKQ